MSNINTRYIPVSLRDYRICEQTTKYAVTLTAAVAIIAMIGAIIGIYVTQGSNLGNQINNLISMVSKPSFYITLVLASGFFIFDVLMIFKINRSHLKKGKIKIDDKILESLEKAELQQKFGEGDDLIPAFQIIQGGLDTDYTDRGKRHDNILHRSGTSTSLTTLDGFLSVPGSTTFSPVTFVSRKKNNYSIPMFSSNHSAPILSADRFPLSSSQAKTCGQTPEGKTFSSEDLFREGIHSPKEQGYQDDPVTWNSHNGKGKFPVDSVKQGSSQGVQTILHIPSLIRGLYRVVIFGRGCGRVYIIKSLGNTTNVFYNIDSKDEKIKELELKGQCSYDEIYGYIDQKIGEGLWKMLENNKSYIISVRINGRTFFIVVYRIGIESDPYSLLNLEKKIFNSKEKAAKWAESNLTQDGQKVKKLKSELVQPDL